LLDSLLQETKEQKTEWPATALSLRRKRGGMERE